MSDPNPKLGLMVRGTCFILLAGYFVWFLQDALSMQFAPDDPMNLEKAVSAGIWRVIGANITFWSSFYRPMGELFYLAVFRLAKFNPIPYHLVILAILGLNAWLTYRIGKIITGFEIAGWITALLMIYHGRLTDLYYLPSFAYDVLCYCFYYSAFLFYLHVRVVKGRLLSGRELGAFLALFICALNSKETAVTLPLLIAVFEVLYHRPVSRASGRPAFIALLVAIGFAVGKALGPDSLVDMPAYRPVLTLGRFLSQHASFLNTLSYSTFFNPTRTAVFYLLMGYIAVTRRSREMGLAISIAVLGALPISFVVGRAGAPLYIACLGWALLAAMVASAVIEFLSREPLFRWLPRPVARGLLLAAGVAMLCRLNSFQRYAVVAAVHEDQAKTWKMIQQFQDHGPKMPRNSRMLILDDPFDGFDTVFIARLWYDDPTSHFFPGNKMSVQPTGAAWDPFQYVISFDQHGEMKQLKP